MPIYEGQDSKGKFLQWGNQTKYYYGRGKGTYDQAYEKARRQAVAIYASGWKSPRRRASPRKSPRALRR